MTIEGKAVERPRSLHFALTKYGPNMATRPRIKRVRVDLPLSVSDSPTTTTFVLVSRIVDGCYGPSRQLAHEILVTEIISSFSIILDISGRVRERWKPSDNRWK